MRALILAAGLFVAALPAWAEKPDTPNANAQGVTAEEAVGIVFTEIEKRLIREYYGKQSGAEVGKGKDKSKQMPHGLAKRDELPPGLQQHILKHGTLPPGLAKRDLPSDLLLKIPAGKKGTQRKIVGTDVVLIQTATGIVLDVLEGVAGAQ